MEERVIAGDLTCGNVSRVIMSFVFPLLLANLLQQSCFIVDSILVGNFLGKEALAAVSASFFLYYFIVSLVIGVGSGISVVISHYCGAGQHDRLQSAFSSVLLFNLVSGVTLSAVGLLLSEPLFRLIKTPEEVIPEAVSYFNVYLGGLCVFIVFNSIVSVLRGMGDAARPLLFVGITSALNILLDFLFIAVLHLGVASAAVATILAQTGGVAVALFHIHKRHPFLSLGLKTLRFDFRVFMQGVRIGVPTSLQQCSMALGLLALLGVVNALGTDTLTAYGAAGKIESLISQVILTLSSAMAAFCGQNIGAGNRQRARDGVRFAMLFNLAFSAAIYLTILCLGTEIMLLFTPDEAVAAIGRNYLLIVGAFFLFNGATNILNGAMRGAGKTLFAMLVSIVSLWFIRLPLAWLLSSRLGADGVWLAIAASMFLAFIITAAGLMLKKGTLRE
jgi:putative MATE family efflux protein